MRKLLIASALERRQSYLIASLRALGFEVSATHRSARVWQALMRQEIDLLVLDASVSSDQLNPWLLIDELGELEHPRLIVLTRPDGNQDRLRAFESGVCYCLSLPVSPAELCALLTAAEKEERKAREGLGKARDYTDPALHIDFANREIRRQGKVFPLTGREFSLMQRLVGNAGKVSTSEELCKCTWGRRAWPAKRTQLKIQILQLRRKIEDDYRTPRYLISRRGLGYAFMPQAAG
jgi:two-component system KDP operon response regulator KdpE